MAPHPSQPGLEVSDSPGLEVVYLSDNAHDTKYGVTEGGSPIGPGGQGYQGIAGSGSGSGYRHMPPPPTTINYYHDGSDKEVFQYDPARRERQRILGLPVILFWVIIILIAAGAIGGGVGGSLAVKNAQLKYVLRAAAVIIKVIITLRIKLTLQIAPKKHLHLLLIQHHLQTPHQEHQIHQQRPPTLKSRDQLHQQRPPTLKTPRSLSTAAARP